jgi:hypothetical protein
VEAVLRFPLSTSGGGQLPPIAGQLPPIASHRYRCCQSATDRLALSQFPQGPT